MRHFIADPKPQSTMWWRACLNRFHPDAAQGRELMWLLMLSRQHQTYREV